MIKTNKPVSIAADRAGISLKDAVKKQLIELGYTVNDHGAYNEEASDYPDFAEKGVKAVLSGESDYAVLICGTGIGMSIAANRHKGIFCGLCTDTFTAVMTREHNNANVLAMGARVIGTGVAAEIVKAFFSTEFSGEERHKKRIEMIDSNLL